MTRITLAIVFLSLIALSQSIVPVGNKSEGDPPKPDGLANGLFKAGLRKEGKTYSQTFSKEAKKLIEPDRSIKMQYSAFLAKRDSGIVKLLELSCEGNAEIELPGVCKVGIPGSGSHYSFRNRHYVSSRLADVRLQKGKLHTNGLLIQGLFVSLGDVPVEGLALTTNGIDHLHSFLPDVSSPLAESQRLQLEKGLKLGDYTYYRNIELKKNHSYGLRLIAYASSRKTLSSDHRVDLIAVFRVVAIEPDGSVTLVWRQLEERDAPMLKDQ
ncbi:MAG TPA: hypothetical protein PKA82_03365 [Pyrinomonadaceae bacterium]|nr:hypothetical protein [Pyrinomonadaceae bacterium]